MSGAARLTSVAASLRGPRGRWLLLGGALLGAGLAASGLVQGEPSIPVPDDAVAVVDGRPVPRADYERALAAVAADRRDGLTDEDRRRVLDRLIDEQLLVAHGEALGLAESDRRVRSDLSSAVVALIASRAEDEPEPDEAELQAFYEAHQERFRRPARVVIEDAFFRGDDAEARAREALAAPTLAGLGDEPDLPLPGGPLPLSALVQRLGPTVARGVAELSVGQTAGPFHASGGYHVVRLLQREAGDLPPLATVRDQVQAEYRRVQAEEALRQFLAERRSEAAISVSLP